MPRRELIERSEYEREDVKMKSVFFKLKEESEFKGGLELKAYGKVLGEMTMIAA